MFKSDRVWKRCWERMVDLQCLDTSVRVVWWSRGILARHWIEMSSGRFGISEGGGDVCW